MGCRGRVFDPEEALAGGLISQGLGANHPMEAQRIDSKASHFMGSGPDAREGVESFLEKRAPHFAMRPSTDMPQLCPWWDAPSFGN